MPWTRSPSPSAKYKTKLQQTMCAENLFDVTAVDDTKIRSVIYSGVDHNTALMHKSELLYASKRHFYNPRIRKHKEEPQ